MATKDNDKSKTSKTARVMNLLSKKPDPAQEETTEIAGGQPSSQPLPPIISSLAPDAAVSARAEGSRLELKWEAGDETALLAADFAGSAFDITIRNRSTNEVKFEFSQK